MLQSAKTEKNVVIKQRIKDLLLASKRTIALGPHQHREKAREAAMDWVAGWDCELDLACCWHASDFMRNVEGRWDDRWMQDKLARYFRNVCDQVFADILVRERPCIPRIITLEHTETVGWHAHGMIATPAHMTREEFKAVLREQWVSIMGGCEVGPIGGHVFWCDERSMNHCSYILKWATDKDEHTDRHLRGFLDVRNTRRP